MVCTQGAMTSSCTQHSDDDSVCCSLFVRFLKVVCHAKGLRKCTLVCCCNWKHVVFSGWKVGSPTSREFSDFLTMQGCSTLRANMFQPLIPIDPLANLDAMSAQATPNWFHGLRTGKSQILTRVANKKKKKKRQYYINLNEHYINQIHMQTHKIHTHVQL